MYTLINILFKYCGRHCILLVYLLALFFILVSHISYNIRLYNSTNIVSVQTSRINNCPFYTHLPSPSPHLSTNPYKIRNNGKK